MDSFFEYFGKTESKEIVRESFLVFGCSIFGIKITATISAAPEDIVDKLESNY